MSRFRLGAAASVACLVFCLALPSAAQDDTKKQIEELKKGQQDILNQLAEIKKLLQSKSQPSGPDVAGKVFALGDNPLRGPNTAKLTLLEFTDYQ